MFKLPMGQTEVTQLRQQLNTDFNLSEIKGLCFDLNIDYDNISGDTKDEKVISLIYYMGRRQGLGDLLKRCRILRPSVEWLDIPEETANAFAHIAASVNLSSQDAKDRDDQLILLQKVKHFWVDGVLKKSLPPAGVIDLDVQRYDQAIEQPWRDVVSRQHYDKSAEPLPRNLLKVFIEEAERALLILGAPGAGKTTTLIQLCSILIALAELDPSQPIPVILNLSSWSERREALQSWIVAELTTKYQIPPEFGRDWLKQNELLCLLDGLDEVETGVQKECVAAINQFRHDQGLTSIVVSCRTEAYEMIQLKLTFGGTLLLNPLTFTQVETYLQQAGADYTGLKVAIEQDKILRELVQSPLMLHIMSVAYRQGELAAPISDSELVAERHDQLLKMYIQQMAHHHGDQPRFAFDKTIHWLSWLAKRMTQHNQTVFLVEQIQPSWTLARGQKWLYLFLTRWCAGLILGLFSWLLALLAYIQVQGTEIKVMESIAVGLGLPSVYDSPLAHLLTYVVLSSLVAVIDGIFFESRGNDEAVINRRHGIVHAAVVCVVIMLVLGLVTARYDPILLAVFGGLLAGGFFVLAFGYIDHGQSFRTEIRTVAALSWSWQAAVRGGIPGVGLGLVIGIIIAILFSPYWGVMFMLSVVLGSFLWSGLQQQRIEMTSFANQGMWLTARNALLAAVAMSLMAGVFFGMILKDVITGLLVGLTIFLGAWSVYGGIELIKHVCVRALLWGNGCVPWQYTRFLDEVAGRVLLRKVGGGYMFMHRSLQTYFDALSGS